MTQPDPRPARPTAPTLLRSTRKPPVTVIFSGMGQDSAAMIALATRDEAFRRRHVPGDLLIVHADTGDENQETVAYRDRQAEQYRQAGIDYLHVTPDQGHHPRTWQHLHHQWERNVVVQCVGHAATCSQQLKIVPSWRSLNDYLARRYGYHRKVGRNSKAALYAYRQDYGPLIQMLGFARGEERRVKPVPDTQRYISDTTDRRFPLIELGLDRAGCQEVTAQLGHEVPYPSACRNCPFTNRRDLLRLHRRDPESFER